MTPFEKIIKEHLEKKAGSDAVFAEKFIERCKADQKAIEGCCAYITAEARKKAEAEILAAYENLRHYGIFTPNDYRHWGKAYKPAETKETPKNDKL